MSRGLVWVSGGVCCAIGLLSLIYSFGPTYTEGNCPSPSCAGINTALSLAGWDAMADIGLKDPAFIAIPMLGLGMMVLVGMNAVAWKQTGGY